MLPRSLLRILHKQIEWKPGTLPYLIFYFDLLKFIRDDDSINEMQSFIMNGRLNISQIGFLAFILMLITSAIQAQGVSPFHNRETDRYRSRPDPLEKYRTNRTEVDTVLGVPQTFTVHKLAKDTTEFIYILNNRVASRWEIDKAIEKNKDAYRMTFFEQKILMKGFASDTYATEKKWVIYVETF